MEKLTATLEEFNQKVVQRIGELLETQGVESEHSNEIVLAIKDEEQMHNLDGSRWLVELNQDNLIDNNGYRYDLSVLNLEDLCSVLDSLID